MIKERKEALANSILIILIGGGVIWVDNDGAKAFAIVTLLGGAWGLGCSIFAKDHYLTRHKPTKERLARLTESRIFWVVLISVMIIFGAVILLFT